MDICYLCGNELGNASRSKDHVVPSTLIQRVQPKASGFDYAGKLLTHEECNNRFGPETYLSKAVQLLGVLTADDEPLICQHKEDPSITIMALDASKLSGFTARDRQFFKLIDVRNEAYETFTNPDFLIGRPRTNPIRDATYVAISVLAKSAAALLIKRKLLHVPEKWKIYAIPHSGASGTTDFDDILGATDAFDVGVKAWIAPLEQQDWLVLYRAECILIYFIFAFSGRDALTGLRQIFPEADILRFRGRAIRDMLDRGWTKV
jgi:hypothetical protein